jgi:heme/copper-type cytochrome/quinol oxidase subunit 3
MKHRAIIDVSNLPNTVLDHRSPIWWGNMLLLAIETTMFALLVAMYFYARVVDFNVWPPPQVNRLPILYNTAPALLLPTINLFILLVSVVPLILADRACLKRDVPVVKAGLVLCVLLGLVVIVIRFFEFKSLNFKWNDNAYASIIWSIVGLHLTHLVIATAENFIITAWVLVKGLDDKHARDVRVTATYWYWVAGIWVLLYFIIWGGARWL